MATKNTENKVKVEKEIDKAEKVISKEEKKETDNKKLSMPDKDELICCRSVVNGQLIYISKRTGMVIEWSNYGDEQYIEFGEIINMRSSQPSFLNKPWIVIDDERVRKYAGLTQIYEKLVPINDLENFFQLDINEILDRINKVSQIPSARELLASKAREMIESKKLYDLRIIQILESELQIDLQTLM